MGGHKAGAGPTETTARWTFYIKYLDAFVKLQALGGQEFAMDLKADRYSFSLTGWCKEYDISSEFVTVEIDVHQILLEA
jgi:hypothetical protein